MLRTGPRGRSENTGKGQRRAGKWGLRVMEDQGAPCGRGAHAGWVRLEILQGEDGTGTPPAQEVARGRMG